MRREKFIICDDLIGAKQIEELYDLKLWRGYALIKKINDDLTLKGKLTLPGYVPKEIFWDYLKSLPKKRK